MYSYIHTHTYTHPFLTCTVLPAHPSTFISQIPAILWPAICVCLLPSPSSSDLSPAPVRHISRTTPSISFTMMMIIISSEYGALQILSRIINHCPPQLSTQSYDHVHTVEFPQASRQKRERKKERKKGNGY